MIEIDYDLFYQLDENIWRSKDGSLYVIGKDKKVVVTSSYIEDLTKLVGNKVVEYREDLQTLIFEKDTGNV